MMEDKISIIPAGPGWFCLIPGYGDFDTIIKIHKEPIIAWEIWTSFKIDVRGDILDIYSTATPIASDDIGQWKNFICRPDGTMFEQGNQEFESIEELIKYLNMRARKLRNRGCE